MGAFDFYAVTLAVYAALNALQALGLNMQFGQTGVINFAYISLVAIGAYGTGIAALHPAIAGSLTQYVGGFGWAFPWDVLFGVGLTLVVALGMSLFAFARLRDDYLALTLFSLGQGMWLLVNNDQAVFNGITGLSNVPGVWASNSSAVSQFGMFGIALAGLAIVYLLYWRVSRAPLGRALKAVRDNEDLASALGKNPWRLKTIGFLLGAAAAGLSGALFIIYTGGWSPAGWLTPETFIVLAAVIIGGRGRAVGVVIGSLILSEGILQGTTFLPELASRPDLVGAIENSVAALAVLGFLWFRPEGILPERVENFARLRARTRSTPASPIDAPDGATTT